MARRVELRGIANALNESFVSRNNDFKGFWTIGQLKLLAINNNLSTMVFPLTPPESDPHCNLGHYVVLHYSAMLAHLLRKQLIPDLWISEASITIDFNVNAEHKHLNECSTSGEPFKCHCQIIDDIGRSYSSVVYGRCRAHSSVQELKSTRKLAV
ncbi:hypothetical protein M8S10_03460 [Enterobacter chuandaensis]|uniref:hypothetical protein n=1 Tax=Enterobacter chuandaensis TaxID=2497875 RepID=UPI0020764839|nr:hypothetical protein [Enterobacter chuandaensis]MCM7587874.1 hypothetical protein [Enterobacter chuandaensis]